MCRGGATLRSVAAISCAAAEPRESRRGSNNRPAEMRPPTCHHTRDALNQTQSPLSVSGSLGAERRDACVRTMPRVGAVRRRELIAHNHEIRAHTHTRTQMTLRLNRSEHKAAVRSIDGRKPRSVLPPPLKPPGQYHSTMPARNCAAHLSGPLDPLRLPAVRILRKCFCFFSRAVSERSSAVAGFANRTLLLTCGVLQELFFLTRRNAYNT